MGPREQDSSKSIRAMLLEFYERVLDEEETEAVIREVEHFGPQILGCRFARVEQEPENPNPGGTSFALRAANDSVVATLSLDRHPTAEASEYIPLFLKMAAWAVHRTKLLVIARQQSDLVGSLRVARKIVEEGLPRELLTTASWQISGLLRPAFHLGGDSFYYLVNDNALCFLLADAVGHGLGSTILASECRALWRGVVFEKDLSLAVARLNALLFENTGPERFVAATLGYCYPDGRIEYISCGQGPLFRIRPGRADLLPECEPPLGMFPDLEFPIQSLTLEPGEGLVCVTDGVLEWCDEAGNMFSEAGMVRVLSQEFQTSQEILEAITRGLVDFHLPESQRDDVCAVALLRHN